MFIYLIGPIYFFKVLSRVAWLTGLCHGNLDILTTKVRIYNSAFATLGILKSEASHFKSNRTWTWTRKFLPLTHSICISQRWGASKKEIWNETFIDNLLSATISRTNKLKQQKLVLPSLSLPTTISLSHTPTHTHTHIHTDTESLAIPVSLWMFLSLSLLTTLSLAEYCSILPVCLCLSFPLFSFLLSFVLLSLSLTHTHTLFLYLSVCLFLRLWMLLFSLSLF